MAKSFGELYAKAELTAGYHAERMAIGFLAELQAQMKARGMSNSDLARAAEVSPAYISKLFRGPSNVSLETVAKLALAVGCRPNLHLANHEASVASIEGIVRPEDLGDCARRQAAQRARANLTSI